MRIPALIIFLSVSQFELFCQQQPYPKEYFKSPLDTVLVLKGTFGEIRPDHFHSGIDLSTNEHEGMPVHASAAGYVSRIKISATGFGKALYLTHPNGYVTVYAHLKSFNPELEKVVSTIQFKKESFEFDTLLKPGFLKTDAGEVIAHSGNSGDSDGPHLHFEIRDEKTEEPINPLLFGLPVQDTIPPVIKCIRLYPQPSKGNVEMADVPVSYPVEKRGNFYFVALPDYVKAYGNIAFGIETSDHANGSSSELGNYSITLMSDSQMTFSSKMDRFSFTNTRYANAAIDYSYRYETGNTISRCFRMPGATFCPFIESMNSNGGFLSFTDEHAHFLQFFVKDFSGNQTELRAEVLSFQPFGNVAYSSVNANEVRLNYSQGMAIHKTEAEIIFQPSSVYDNSGIPVEEESQKDGFYSRTILVGNPAIPLHVAFRIGLKPHDLPDSLSGKAVVIRFGKDNQQAAISGEWNNGMLTATTRQFGRFTIGIDTTPPLLTPIFDTTFSSPSALSFQASDNLTGIKYYRATLNNKWVLTEYDAKNGTLTVVLPVDRPEFNELILTVGDEKKNQVTFRKSF